MTVTLSINQRKTKVDNSLLQTSELVKNSVIDLGREDIDVDIPSRYWPVVDVYLDLIHKISHDEKGQVVYLDDPPIIDDINILFLCFFMETFFVDTSFFIYLMKQAYGIWNEFYPNIKLLPDERSIYLHTPYEFVPKTYMDRESFFNEWLGINANKDAVLCQQSTEIYHTDVKYYPSKQVKELKVYHTISGEKIGFLHERGWYEASMPSDASVCADTEHKEQLKHQCNYKDGKEDGLQEAWYANGQLQYRVNYKDGEADGLQEAWYSNPSPKGGQLWYRRNFKDGMLDGLWEGWHEDGRPKYQRVYDMGTPVSEEWF